MIHFNGLSNKLCLFLGIYSASRTVKLAFPFSMSYQPMSCRIRDAKYFTRIRVIWEIAVWLKQSTQMAPTINWIIVSTMDTHRKAIESFMSSWWFSSGDASVLYETIFKYKSKLFNWQSKSLQSEKICSYRILPPPNHFSTKVGVLVPWPYVRSTISVVISP